MRPGVWIVLLCAVAAVLPAADRATVGYTEAPPLSTRRPGGPEPRGFAVDVLEEAARRAGIRLTWRYGAGSSDIDRKLEAGQFDLFAAGVVTPQRRARLYVSEPWWSEDTVLVTREGTPIQAGNWAGVTIAIPSPVYAGLVAAYFPGATLHVVAGPDPAAVDVCTGAGAGALMTQADINDKTSYWPVPCRDVRLRVVSTEARLQLAILANPAKSSVAQRLRKRIEDMAVDGTLIAIARRHPDIPAASAVDLADFVRQRYQNRTMLAAVAALLVIACAVIAVAVFALRSRDRLQRTVRAEEEARLKLRAVVDNLSEGVITFDPEGRALCWNPSAKRLFGFQPDDDLSNLGHVRGLFETHTPEGNLVPDGEWPVARVLREQAVQGLELVLCRDGIDDRTFEFFGKMVRDNAGRALIGIVTFRDITEQRRAAAELCASEKALKRSNEELGAFAYTVSHDLQEPLRNITAYCDLLDRRCADAFDLQGRQFLRTIFDGSRRMQSMLSGLLTYSRVGDENATKCEVDCGYVVRSTLDAFSSQLRETGSRVTIGPMPRLIAWEGRLDQVFQNLIGNALKYRRTDVATEIRVTAELRGAKWQFEVADNGQGFDPTYAERIFAVFKRLHGGEQYPGTGIGLAICRKIVERHGGRIWAESTPGAGSRFFFTIPADQPTERAA